MRTMFHVKHLAVYNGGDQMSEEHELSKNL